MAIGDPIEMLSFAQTVLHKEGQAVAALAERLGEFPLSEQFLRAVSVVRRCAGCVVVCGMGKAGLVGQKIAATFASTGTPSHFLHPAEAVHGDLGRVHRNDVLLVLSSSGETEEITRLLPALSQMAASLIAMTARRDSSLAQAAQITLDLDVLEEACALGLAPSTSTTAMLALGDALALTVSRCKGFGSEDFARFHPGGSLGKKLACVEDVMRPLNQCRVAEDSLSVREVLIQASLPGRRTGAIMLTGAGGRLTGLFTDSDLARLLERQNNDSLDEPIRQVMTAAPQTMHPGQRVTGAIALLKERKISELPVVDEQARPLGLVDITDVVGLSEDAPAEPQTRPQTRPKIRRFPSEAA